MKQFFKNLFGGETTTLESLGAIGVDMHSHILPGLDDGAETLERSLELVQGMQQLGYRKLIMTPHIMSDFYRNTPEGIRERLQLLKGAVAEAGIEIELGCAAEYYLDEVFLQKLEDDEELLTFGDRCLLFETSFLNEPLNLREAIFKMQSRGYKPVLAHPERYSYFYGKFDELVNLREQGVLLQPNLNSLTGYYSPAAKAVAEKLIDNGLVDLVGSDVHSTKHLGSLQRVLSTKYISKVLSLPLLNPQL
ncbi:MAG TPA: CpsB/CapC family capsule biosynthesis tyrosine phosphatase [Pontibacter sp.]